MTNNADNLKVSFYGKNFLGDPSSYYSIYQYIRKTDGSISRNFRFHTLCPNIIYSFSMTEWARNKLGLVMRKLTQELWLFVAFPCFALQDKLFFRPDVIFINRDIFPIWFPHIFRPLYRSLLNGRRVIWKFDDNIKSNEISDYEWNLLTQRSDKIVVSNDHLKSTLPRQAGTRAVLTGHNAIDTDLSKLLRTHNISEREASYDDRIEMIWSATGGNIPNLDYVINAMDIAAEILMRDYGKELWLNVVCNIAYRHECRHLRINNIKWTRAVAAKWICRSHIGVMPLIDSDYNRGKSAFKIVQYLSAGIPSIASNMPMHHKLLETNVGTAGIVVEDTESSKKWTEAIVRLGTNKAFWLERCAAAVNVCDRYHNADIERGIWMKSILGMQRKDAP